jgi:hypothetical protein
VGCLPSSRRSVRRGGHPGRGPLPARSAHGRAAQGGAPGLVPLLRRRRQLHRPRLAVGEPMGRVPSQPRDELLAIEQFDTLLEAQVLVADWRIEYNTCRPHSALGMLTPAQFADQWVDQPTQALVAGGPINGVRSCPTPPPARRGSGEPLPVELQPRHHGERPHRHRQGERNVEAAAQGRRVVHVHAIVGAGRCRGRGRRRARPPSHHKGSQRSPSRWRG